MVTGLWYLKRLGAMSAPEIAHRIAEQAKRKVSQFVSPDLRQTVNEKVGLPEFPALREGLAKLATDHDLIGRWRNIARLISEGRHCALGVEWPRTKGKKRWHIDPVTGALWPQEKYCFRISFRHARNIGDIKYVWELNRLQFLQPVAALAALQNDQELAILCVREIESWIEANPPFRGVNWVSGIELACRVVSIITVCSLLGRTAFSRDQTSKILSSLAVHGYWLMRYPSKFSSANNHLIAEAGALFLLGLLGKGFKEASKWEQYGRTTLEQEVIKQIYDDGVGAEQSPTYTAFTLEWLLLCGVMAYRRSQPFSDCFWRRIARAGEFLAWIVDADGNYPAFGDDDEGRVIYSHPEGRKYVSGVLTCLSNSVEGMLDAPRAEEGHLRQAFFGRSRGRKEKRSGIRCFGRGGYTVVQSKAGDTRHLLLFDHGPLGYLSIAAHGHADALAIWLHIGGQPVLVDAGTYLYHAGGRWRDHARGTAAHNTLMLEDTDSSKIAGPFNWSRKATCRLINFESAPQHWLVEAEHDGYEKEFGVLHRRRLVRVSEKVIAVTDMLKAEKAAKSAFDAEIGFLVHPMLSIQPLEMGWRVDDGDRELLLIRHLGETLQSEVMRGQSRPPRGWYSDEFGKKEPASRLAFRGRLEVERECVFLLELR